MGLRVLGTAGTPEGLQLVKANGATDVFNHREEGYISKIMVRFVCVCVCVCVFCCDKIMLVVTEFFYHE